MPKNGASKGRQVYRCGNCGRYYTHGAAYTRPSAAGREQALALLGEGISRNAIAHAELYRSDAYPVYGSWLPPDSHVVGKGGAVNRTRACIRSCGASRAGWCRIRKVTPRARQCRRMRWLCCWWTGPQNSTPVYVENTGPRPMLASLGQKRYNDRTRRCRRAYSDES